jgi:hypothetical protein
MKRARAKIAPGPVSSTGGTTRPSRSDRLAQPAAHAGVEPLDVVMTIKLFAHILRSGDAGASTEAGPLDVRHWIFRDFVVRRHDFAPWGVPSTPAGDAEPLAHADAGPAEPVWADTQPCWRE